MGAIADAAVRVLHDGPCPVSHLSRRLATDGVTRARDPVRAVRRALRGDRRVIEIGCDLLAMREHALAGVTLTRRITGHEAAGGLLEVDDDLSPIAGPGPPLVLRLPHGTPAHAVVALRVTDALRGLTAMMRVSTPPARPDDERALVATVTRGLAAVGGALPLVRLRDALLTVAAVHPSAFRVPGRPLTDVLADAGLQAHLGWVGSAGTDWSAIDEVEAALLAHEVSDLVSRDRVAVAVDRQARLLRLCDASLPHRAGAERHRMAALLDRAGRPAHAIGVLAPLARVGDPDAYYAMAVVHLGAGDEVSARRVAQEGLARATGPRGRQARECLADLASQLDGEAALQRFASRTPGPAGWMRAPETLARSVLRLERSHLVEAVVEEIGLLMPDADMLSLVRALARTDSRWCDDLLVVAAAVLEGPAALVAARCARGLVPTSPAARVLARPVAVAAWATAPADAPDQQQVIIAAARDGGRVAPLVALIDHHDLGGVLKDAFVLPDMVPARLWREVLSPMGDAGIRARPFGVPDARHMVGAATDAALALGLRIPSQQYQPVVRRIQRLCGTSQATCSPGTTGGRPGVG